MADQDNEFL
jgi:chromosome segregation ATPase